MHTKRRTFLKAAGYVSLAFAMPWDTALSQATTKPRLPGDLDSSRQLSAWLRINADQTVTLLVGKVELGQGILTAVAQVCADELDIDLGRLKIISGDTALVPNEGVTAGSTSVSNCATAVQYASAEVRAMLLAMAAEKLQQDISTLKVHDGQVIAPNGQRVDYGSLVTGLALEREATGKATLKPAGQYRYIGQSIPRLDLAAKTLGDAIFVQEMRPQGLLFGHVVRPPTYASRLLAVDDSSARKMPGVAAVVRNGSFLGVVARSESQALAAAQALASSARWHIDKALPTHEGIYDWLRKTKPNRVIQNKNQVRNDAQTPAQTLTATYLRPYQMHGSIGTSAAIATMGTDGVMLIQTHSQSVFETSLAIAKMLGLEPAKVRCQHVQGSGCYGHNMADDAAADAALLAMAVPGQPVRLQYTREQEHLWEPYGSAMVVQTQATLNAQGQVLDWDLQLWSTPHVARPSGDPGNLLSARYLEKPFAQPLPANYGPPNYAADRNAIALYDFPGHRVQTHFITDMPVRVSSTRGLGAYANVFAIESFMDELARATQADPVSYRLRHLQDPRARDVVQKAADAFGWSTWRAGPNRGRGLAFAKYKNIAGYCAVAMEVEVNPRSGHIRVIRAVASTDCGHIVSPDGVRNQIEGGLIQSLSWTMKEQVHFDETR